MTTYRPSRTFTATEATSDGIRVQVIVTVPDDITWKHYRECGELAQMGATRVMESVERSHADAIQSAREEAKEMPF